MSLAYIRRRYDLPCHPTWQVIYYAADGHVLADFTTSTERGGRADGSGSSLPRV